MKILTFLFVITSFYLSAQENLNLDFNSKILSETRSITVHIPESYKESKNSYPVIYALDGEYAKLALNGTVDYYSFWDKIPECIVVSIDQNYRDTTQNKYKRWIDCAYDWNSGLPNKQGEKFRDFISKELVPYIDNSYRTTSFRTIIGHSFTANFVNYFLMEEQSVFTGYIAISPYFASNGLHLIKTVIENTNRPLFYFVASGEKDLSGHIKSVNEFDKQFAKIENENFNYKKFNMKGNQASHYTIFPIALPDAIEHVFSMYSPISENEFDKILKTQDKFEYLKNRYDKIKEVYGIEIIPREEDINAVSYAISKKKQWGQLKEIGQFAIEIYPESYLGYWTMGEYNEKSENYESALQYYEIGFSKLGEDILNISDFQKNIDRVKKKIE